LARRSRSIVPLALGCWNPLTWPVCRTKWGKKGLVVEQQKPVPLVYEEVKLECGYRMDLLVERSVVVEVKSIDALAPIHEAQTLSYLRLSGCKLALLINFNVTILKDGIRRFINGSL
jgi:GxxExxY protein